VNALNLVLHIANTGEWQHKAPYLAGDGGLILEDIDKRKKQSREIAKGRPKPIDATLRLGLIRETAVLSAFLFKMIPNPDVLSDRLRSSCRRCGPSSEC
jgi:hypothetical protein